MDFSSVLSIIEFFKAEEEKAVSLTRNVEVTELKPMKIKDYLKEKTEENEKIINDKEDIIEENEEVIVVKEDKNTEKNVDDMTENEKEVEEDEDNSANNEGLSSEQNQKEGGDKMAEKKVKNQDCNCGSGDNSNNENCSQCRKIPFCSTLTLTQGLEFATASEQNRKQYIKQNLVVMPKLNCLISKNKECVIKEAISGCGDLTVSQLLIKGCIPFVASVPGVFSISNPNLDPVSICCEDVASVNSFTPVCLTCTVDCTNLKIVDIVNIQVKKVGNSCGDRVFEVKGKFVFAC